MERGKRGGGGGPISWDAVGWRDLRTYHESLSCVEGLRGLPKGWLMVGWSTDRWEAVCFAEKLGAAQTCEIG